MFDRFTEHAKNSMSLARQASQEFNHEDIGTEHILLGTIRVDNGVATSVLRNLDIDLEQVVHEVEKIVKLGKRLVTADQLPFTPRGKKVLELSMEEASRLGHNYIGTEHLLLGLIGEGKGIAAQVLINLGVRLKDARQKVMDHLREPYGPSKLSRLESYRVTSRTVWTHWYGNGQRQSEGSYENHDRQGQWTFWNEDGSIDENRTGLYRDGKLTED